jgi:hypothetical protein
LLILLFLLSVIMNIYQWANSKNTTTVDTKLDSLVTVRVDLEQEISSATAELTRYKGLSLNLDSLVNEGNKKIGEQEEKIKQMLKKENDYASLNRKLNMELTDLKKLKEIYLEKIDSLITTNEQLTNQNTKLNSTLARLAKEKILLEQKVNVASQLKAESMYITAMKKKGDTKYTMTSLAKKTNTLKICFILQENKITPQGKKTISLRLITPDGVVMADKNQPIQTFVNVGTKEEMTCTVKKIIGYANVKQDVCLEHEDDQKVFSSGTYLVEVYVDGYLSGSTSYLLR